MQARFQPLTKRFVVFVLTLATGLSIVLARKIYTNRQGLFVYAAYNGNVTLMRLTSVLGVDINAPGCDYGSCWNALSAAINGHHPAAARYLLDQGADANAFATRRPRIRVLTLASYYGDVETVRLLLAHGADVHFANSERETALTIAIQRENDEVVALLRQAGAKQ